MAKQNLPCTFKAHAGSTKFKQVLRPAKVKATTPTSPMQLTAHSCQATEAFVAVFDMTRGL
jgi:hypothetical protein